MKRLLLISGVAALFLGWNAQLEARVPMTRNPGIRTAGIRGDRSVPYLTTGRTAFGAYSVGPKIVSSPNVIEKENPGAHPVYNIIFYGAVQSFGDKFNGATAR